MWAGARGKQRGNETMKHFLRPYQGIGMDRLVLGAGMVAVPRSAGAQSMPMVELLQGTSPLMLHRPARRATWAWTLPMLTRTRRRR